MVLFQVTKLSYTLLYLNKMKCIYKVLCTVCRENVRVQL